MGISSAHIVHECVSSQMMLMAWRCISEDKLFSLQTTGSSVTALTIWKRQIRRQIVLYNIFVMDVRLLAYAENAMQFHEICNTKKRRLRAQTLKCPFVYLVCLL